MLGIIRFILCVVFSLLYVLLLGSAILLGVAKMPTRKQEDPFLAGLWKWLSDKMAEVV